MKKYDAFLLSLGIGLFLAIAMCCFQAGAQRDLGSKIIRLHVLANSDSPQDQAVKLKVRDAVLGCGIKSPDPESLKRAEEAANVCLEENGMDYRASVTYGKTYFDTRIYDGFALPAGYYNAVRVSIGRAEGKNWWCVIYPSLCTDLAEEECRGILSEDEISYIKRDGEKYVVRFKLQELISEMSFALFG